MPPSGSAREKVPRNNLNENQRSRLIEHLLSGSKGGEVGPGDLKNAAKEFSCSRYQVMGVWKRYKQQKEDGVVAIDLRNRRRGNSGRKGIDVAKLNEALLEVPLKNRTTQRAVAAQLGIPQQTLHQNLKKLGMRAASRFLKPLLTEQGKARRLAWAVRWVVVLTTVLCGVRRFSDCCRWCYCCCIRFWCVRVAVRTSIAFTRNVVARVAGALG